MTEEQKAIVDLWNLIERITESARKHDLSYFRAPAYGACDMYQGMPPICRVRDELFDKHEKAIGRAYLVLRGLEEK